MPSLSDINTPEDVELFVRAFYEGVYQDELLRPMFAEHAGVNMEDHLPTMNRFWCHILLGIGEYDGNPFPLHHKLHRIAPITEEHFERWLGLFRRTLDAHFEGPNVEKAMRAATGIAESFQWRLAMISMSSRSRAQSEN